MGRFKKFKNIQILDGDLFEVVVIDKGLSYSRCSMIHGNPSWTRTNPYSKVDKKLMRRHYPNVPVPVSVIRDDICYTDQFLFWNDFSHYDSKYQDKYYKINIVPKGDIPLSHPAINKRSLIPMYDVWGDIDDMHDIANKHEKCYYRDIKNGYDNNIYRIIYNIFMNRRDLYNDDVTLECFNIQDYL